MLKTKLCYIYTYKFNLYIKTDEIYNDNAEYVETRFNTSNYELECNFIDRSLSKIKNEKVIGSIKYELGEKIMTQFFRVRAKNYGYLTDNRSHDNKAKSTKMYVIKNTLKSENYKSCLEATQLENKIKLVHLSHYYFGGSVCALIFQNEVDKLKRILC